MYGTTNVSERLFIRDNIVMADFRRRMTPRHFEMVMFLRANRHFSEIIVQKVTLNLALD